MRILGTWFVVALAVVLAVGCGGGGGGGGGGDSSPAPGGTPGVAGGPCYPNATCNAGLECASSVCVDPSAAAGGAGGACYPNNTCDAGLACEGGVCVVAGGEPGEHLDGGQGDDGGAGRISRSGVLTVNSYAVYLLPGEQFQIESSVIVDDNSPPLAVVAQITSVDPSIASVTPSGLITAVSEGATQVMVDSEDYGRAIVQAFVVEERPAGTVFVEFVPAVVFLNVGESATMGMMCRDSQGEQTECDVTFQSTDPTIVQTAANTITGLSPGTVVISAHRVDTLPVSGELVVVVQEAGQEVADLPVCTEEDEFVPISARLVSRPIIFTAPELMYPLQLKTLWMGDGCFGFRRTTELPDSLEFEHGGVLTYTRESGL